MRITGFILMTFCLSCNKDIIPKEYGWADTIYCSCAAGSAPVDTLDYMVYKIWVKTGFLTEKEYLQIQHNMAGKIIKP